MLTKNTTHQYTQAEINRYTPEIDPELPTEFQIGTESRQVTTSDDDREMDFSNFMQKSFKNAESERESDKEPDFDLGRVPFYPIKVFTLLKG